MDNPKVTTAATGSAVDQGALKRHLRIFGADQDAWLADVSPVAVEWLEDYLGRSLLKKSYTWTLDAFGGCRGPLDDFWYGDSPSGEPADIALHVPRLPLVSVTSLKYTDAAGTVQTLAANQYDVDAVNGRILPSALAGRAWPQTGPYINAVEVIFIAGYGDDASAIPVRLRQAINMLMGHWYENREAMSNFSLQEVPLGVLELVGDYRQVVL